ncbi:MAG: SPOR domain-containing protein [Giesbergeria sp.]|jgi:DedD protein
MAFFKFRWPGQKGQGDKATKPARPAKAESIEVMRRRARHRLIGAAVLVLLGVVGFPILFDTQPRPIQVDIPIEIPDRNKAVPLVVPGVESSATAVGAAPASNTTRPAERPAHVAVEAASDAPVAREVRPAATAAVTPAPAPTPLPKHVEPKSEPKPESKVPVAPPVRATPPSDDAERARALLEGRSVKTPVAPAAADGERFIVQIGAFAEADKVREVRQKLERAGIKTYTQVVDTKDGKRTRVRVGPFEGRAEAEKAAARIKGLGLPVSLLLL